MEKITANKVILPFWCIDAMLCMQKTIDNEITQEWLSRLECFAEAVICHDTLLIPERYHAYEELIKPEKSGVIEFFKTDNLVHSWDLSEECTLNLSYLLGESAGKLYENSDYWGKQNFPTSHLFCSPEVGYKMNLMRLWQASSTIEAAVKFNADFIFPNSLAFNIEKSSHDLLKLHIDCIKNKSNNLIKIKANISTLDPLLTNNTTTPIFLLLALSKIDQFSSRNFIESLILLRRELLDLRVLRHKIQNQLKNCNTIDKIDKLNSDYQKLVSDILSEKSTEKFLQRKMSIEEITDSVLGASQCDPISACKFIIKHTLDQFNASEGISSGGFTTLGKMIRGLDIERQYCIAMDAKNII